MASIPRKPVKMRQSREPPHEQMDTLKTVAVNYPVSKSVGSPLTVTRFFTPDREISADHPVNKIGLWVRAAKGTVSQPQGVATGFGLNPPLSAPSFRFMLG